MARKQPFLAADWSESWKESYARLSGDRIVFHIEKGMIFFVDIVHHDDIGRYGRRPKR